MRETLDLNNTLGPDGLVCAGASSGGLNFKLEASFDTSARNKVK